MERDALLFTAHDYVFISKFYFSLSVSSVHFTFIISITKLIALCYTSCISFDFVSSILKQRIKELLTVFLHLLSASHIYFKISFLEFGVVWFVSQFTEPSIILSCFSEHRGTLHFRAKCERHSDGQRDCFFQGRLLGIIRPIWKHHINSTNSVPNKHYYSIWILQYFA